MSNPSETSHRSELGTNNRSSRLSRVLKNALYNESSNGVEGNSVRIEAQEKVETLLFVELEILQPVLEELQTLRENLTEDEVLKAFGDEHGWNSNEHYTNQSNLPEALTQNPQLRKYLKLASILSVLIPGLASQDAYAQNLIPTPTKTPKPTVEILVPTATMTPESAPILKRAVVTAESLRVRKGPGTAFEVETNLTQGTEVTIVPDDNENDGWVKIIFVDPVTNKEVAGEFYVSEEFLEVTGIITPTPTATEKPVTLIPTVTPTPDQTPKPASTIRPTATVSLTSTVTNTETISPSGTINTEAVGGGNAEAQALLDLAKEQLPDVSIQTISFAHQVPLIMDERGYLVAVYQNSKWEKYTFPESIRPSQASATLTEVQRIFSEAADAKFSMGIINIFNANGEMIARVENSIVSPLIEESLLSFLLASPEFKHLPALDSIVVENIEGINIAEVNDSFFIYLKQWKLTTPDIREQLATSTFEEDVPLAETEIVKDNEILVTLREGYDLDGKVKLDEDAEQVILGWLADAFSQSDVLAPIMGATQEEVLNNLRNNNFRIPAEFKIPSQLPPVVQNIIPYDRVKFLSPLEAAPGLEIPADQISLNEIILEAVWNNELDKYEDIEQFIVWTGSSKGQEGSALWLDNQGILHLTAIVKVREPLFTEEPERIINTASKRIWMAAYMYKYFNGNTESGGEEFAYQKAFADSNNIPEGSLLDESQILQLTN